MAALVVFEATCSCTRPGESLFLVGGGEALGDWSPAKALPLTTSAPAFPRWSSEPVTLPAGQTVEFKMLVQHPGGSGGGSRWEEIQGNRSVVLPPCSQSGKPTKLSMSWGSLHADAEPAPASAPAAAAPASAVAAQAQAQAQQRAQASSSPTERALASVPTASGGAWLRLRLGSQPHGCRVVACGDSAALGNWKTAQAPELARGGTQQSQNADEEWYCEARPDVAPGTPFKYVLLSDSGEARWEEGQNRQWPGKPALHCFGAPAPREVADGEELVIHWGGPEVQALDPLSVPGAVLHAFHWPFEEVRRRAREVAAHGFDAVQLSPAQRSISGDQWWTRYQPVRYEEIHGLGDEHALRAACAECRAAGMAVYGDLVFNHMQVVASCDEWKRAQHDQGHLDHLKQKLEHALGPTFNRDDFQWPWKALEGEAWDGPDRMEGWGCGEWSELKGGSPKVMDVHTAHMEKLKACGVAGFRFDAAKHMRPEHIAEYVRRAGVYCFGEVLSVDPAMQHEYTAGGPATDAPLPTTDFLLAVWLRSFLEGGETAVDFELNAWVKHLIDVEFKRGGSPPKVVGNAQRDGLQAPVLAQNSVRFARNHDTVCNDVPFYGIGGWSREAAQVAAAWLLAAHDGTVLLLSDDVRASPLLRRALLYRRALREAMAASAEVKSKGVVTCVRARRALDGGPPAVVCIACRVKGEGGRLLGFCALNPHASGAVEFHGSGCLAIATLGSTGDAEGTMLADPQGGSVMVRPDGSLDEPRLLGPRDGIFFVAPVT